MEVDAPILLEPDADTAINNVDVPVPEDTPIIKANTRQVAKPVRKNKPRKKITISRDAAPEPDVVVVHDPTMLSEPRLPVARVKAFMRMDPDGKNMSADAVYLMTKATVRKIESLTYD